MKSENTVFTHDGHDIRCDTYRHDVEQRNQMMKLDTVADGERLHKLETDPATGKVCVRIRIIQAFGIQNGYGRWKHLIRHMMVADDKVDSLFFRIRDFLYCFYAAVEMRDFPELRDVPLAIGGSRDRRGVISTANYAARKFGVRSAMPTGQALKLCPHLTLRPGRMEVYKDVSRHIREIFQRYTSLIEPLSLDEAYLDVTDCTQCYGSATLIAEQIRKQIAEELNLTASAGIAPIKFLAKIASDLNKPNGQYVITPAQVDDFILTLSLKKIPGVGKVTAAKLSELGLNTCADVRRYNLAELLRRFGKFGRVLWERCHGQDEREVMPDRLRKSVGVERTLSEDIHSWAECEVLLEKLYEELERRLAKVQPDLHIARQGVKLKFHDFQQTTQEHVWPILDKRDLFQVARQAWDERRNSRGVRLVGLHVTLLDPQLEKQLSLDIDG